ncbi:MAG: carbon-nitrogen hydrolase family protein [Helicobacter sp.]|nr:carbon-nitrogen hydrolase family protein [Helicobacter sp.]
MRVAALQLSSFRNKNEIAAYLQAAVAQKVKILVMGEYLLNPFFKDFENIKKDLLLDSAKDIQYQLIEISNAYALTIVAPVFEVVGNKIYKSLGIINRGKILFYRSQRLMPYEHWNEVKFFSNTIPKTVKMPPVFEIGGMKFSVVFGYELHFDEFWLMFKKNQVDCVLLSSASTFDSSLRWRSIIKMRAFLNNCYILRANRIGQYRDEMTHTLWNFYGDSLLVNPNGEVVDCLGDREELLIANLDKKYLKQIKECWKFR